MFVALLVAWAVAASIPALSSLFRGSSEPLGLILGAAAIFVVGVIDDFRDMSAPAKVAGAGPGRHHPLFHGGRPGSSSRCPWPDWSQLSPEWTPLLTALWVIAITNAVNLIDGLDGLAAGVVAIASGALAVYGLHLQHLGNLPTDNIGPLIAVITCGICLGFLPHNFHPAKIFMGDAGALLLGLLMAASTMLIGGRVRRARSAGWRPEAVRPTSSSPPCSSPSSSSGCPSSTWPSPSSGGPPTAPGSPPRTRTTSTTGCCAWATATAAASSSCGPGRSCCPGFILFPLVHLERQRHHPLRRPGPGGHPLHPVPPLAAPAGRARGRGRRCRPGAEPASEQPRRTGSGTGRPRRATGRGRTAQPAAGPPGARRWSRPATGGSRPAKCERSVSSVLPPQAPKCDDAARELQASRPIRGYLSGRRLRPAAAAEPLREFRNDS